jgi:hypothetical protein
VLVIEPDRDGLLSPLPHDRVNRAFWAYRRSINPRIGIEAYGMMKVRGLADVRVLPGVQAQTAPPTALASASATACPRGPVSVYFASGGLKGGARAGTVTFHGLILAQLLHAISSRSETRGFSAEFERRPNYALYNAIGASIGLQAAAQFVPFLRRFLNLAPLGAADLLGIGAIAIGSSLANDILGRFDLSDGVTYPGSRISAGSTDDV